MSDRELEKAEAEILKLERTSKMLTQENTRLWERIKELQAENAQLHTLLGRASESLTLAKSKGVKQ